MTLTPEFIKFYNYTFKFIHDEALHCGHGQYNLEEFWKGASKILLADLDKTVKIRGLRGAYDYWKYILKEEGAIAKLNYYPDNKLELIMDDCPSCRILGGIKWENYCHHCFYMYEPIFRKHGYKYELKEKGNRKCRILIQKEKS